MEEQWIINLECKLEKTLAAQIESWKMGYILRVPRYLREVYENDLNPKIVSFGPYHHNQDHLKLFQPFKHRALRNYLIRAGRTLAEVAEAMRKTVKEVMELYIGLDETWTEDRFIELMLLDGCFLLDLLIWHSFQFQPLSLVMILQTDALRLENQLLISVLAELLEVGGHKLFHFDVHGDVRTIADARMEKDEIVYGNNKLNTENPVINHCVVLVDISWLRWCWLNFRLYVEMLKCIGTQMNVYRL